MAGDSCSHANMGCKLGEVILTTMVFDGKPRFSGFPLWRVKDPRSIVSGRPKRPFGIGEGEGRCLASHRQNDALIRSIFFVL